MTFLDAVFLLVAVSVVVLVAKPELFEKLKALVKKPQEKPSAAPVEPPKPAEPPKAVEPPKPPVAEKAPVVAPEPEAKPFYDSFASYSKPVRNTAKPSGKGNTFENFPLGLPDEIDPTKTKLPMYYRISGAAHTVLNIPEGWSGVIILGFLDNPTIEDEQSTIVCNVTKAGGESVASAKALPGSTGKVTLFSPDKLPSKYWDATAAVPPGKYEVVISSATAHQFLVAPAFR